VEILGVLRGARGPGQDMILVRLHGTKPEYTGVVEGMSGSPVYIGNKLLGALSYRIGQFSKEPIAGVTPIEDMLEVRTCRVAISRSRKRARVRVATEVAVANVQAAPEMELQDDGNAAGDERLPAEAVATVAEEDGGDDAGAGSRRGMGGTSQAGAEMLTAAEAGIEPGSAVSAQLVRGDMEISATCHGYLY